ncbi:hypothetical protein RHS01_03678 [Rhizoctonia solani]|uniref:Uncharacterized protein n=1 Tax=Rhizoctonia solani TaxID=456999 RepID=A0A8H7M1K8_9AGAM|nr:hypothetical protein RHS01_11453 [Rhizoctonia solani]KAF8747303.1 hypothetical protein RHS01_11330 [Rhizoctonia solani]KAF8747873.1 hypothetical protein RHS01_11224 [Rhizoctonia solani]KAF8757631.1 hypothetical protein RHS01_03678 [Rhizoctonia solani]
MPDIEVFLMDDDHPLNAVQPVGWNCRKPWANYDYATELVKIGFPYIPRPICFKEDVYHFPAILPRAPATSTSQQLLRDLPQCSIIIITATKQMEYSNSHVGYIRAPPPAFWRIVFGAVCMVTRSPGYQSQDSLSTDTTARRSTGTITPPPENVPPPQLVDFAENGDSFTAPEYAPLHAANKAGKFPAPEYAHGHELDIAALTQQLSWLPSHRASNPSPPGSVTTSSSVWEWPGEPNPVVDLGPPEWPAVPQQHTPPFSWEDHWHEVHARDLELATTRTSTSAEGSKSTRTYHSPLPVV